MLKIHVIEARDLPVMDSSRNTTDAYVQIFCPGNVVNPKTKTQMSNLNPKWNMHFQFEYDKESLLQDEPLQFRVRLLTPGPSLRQPRSPLPALARSPTHSPRTALPCSTPCLTPARFHTNPPPGLYCTSAWMLMCTLQTILSAGASSTQAA